MPKYVIERNMPGAGSLPPEALQAASQTSCSVLRKLGPEDSMGAQLRDRRQDLLRLYCPKQAVDRGACPARRISGQPHSEVKAIIDPTTATVSRLERRLHDFAVRNAQKKRAGKVIPGPLPVQVFPEFPGGYPVAKRARPKRPGTFALVRGPVVHGVLDMLTFAQRVEALIGHGRMMEKHVLSAVGLNETKALVLNQLFNLTGRHTHTLLNAQTHEKTACNAPRATHRAARNPQAWNPRHLNLQGLKYQTSRVEIGRHPGGMPLPIGTQEPRLDLSRPASGLGSTAHRPPPAYKHRP